jgi:filamentous hemagglutinin
MVKPNVGQYIGSSGVSILANAASEKYPGFSPAINETANVLNNSAMSNNVQNTMSSYWQRVLESLSGAKKNAKN